MGEIRAVMLNPDGSVAQDTGWLKNRILDQGLTMMGNNNAWGSRGHIGSSSAAVVDSQTGLQAWLAQSVYETFIERTLNPVAPNYEGYEISKWRFDAGVGTGTIREFGIGPGASNSLTTRVLVTPDMPKSSVQVLDVYYKMTCYPDLNTYVGVINIDEDGVLVPYNVISRGQQYGAFQTDLFSVIIGGYSGSIRKRYMDGNLGAGLTGYPSGTTAGGYPNYLDGGYLGTQPYGTIYSSGSHTRYKDIYLGADLDRGNISSGLGIRTAYLDFGIGWDWGCQYNRVSDGGRIQKNNTKIIQLNYRYSWTRL
jgi:hypothetical protein